MSELFTQNYSDKPLFHTDTDISESLHNQVDEAPNGAELLDNTEKQAESLLSNDDYVSETKDTISDDRDDVAEGCRFQRSSSFSSLGVRTESSSFTTSASPSKTGASLPTFSRASSSARRALLSFSSCS